MSDHIYRLAVRYLEAHDEHKRLIKARGSSVCEHEARDQHGNVVRLKEEEKWGQRAWGPLVIPATRPDDYYGPCWAGEWDDGGEYGSEYYVNGDEYPEAWCDSCLARQKIHEAIPAAAQRKAGRLSALLSATRARMRKEES